MHGGFQVALIDHIDLYFRSLLHTQRRAGDRAVVRKHPHFLLLDRLPDRCDSQFVGVAVRECDNLAVASFGKARWVTREGCGIGPDLLLMLHVQLTPVVRSVGTASVALARSCS